MAPYMPDRTKASSFIMATSMPAKRAATSESWMARMARPVGLSIRLVATQAPTTIRMPEIQYQSKPERKRKPNSSSRSTGMPSGPPVNWFSLVKTIYSKMPKPSVATAR